MEFVGVLRLRSSQSARAAPLRMTAENKQPRSTRTSKSEMRGSFDSSLRSSLRMTAYNKQPQVPSTSSGQALRLRSPQRARAAPLRMTAENKQPRSTRTSKSEMRGSFDCASRDKAAGGFAQDDRRKTGNRRFLRQAQDRLFDSAAHDETASCFAQDDRFWVG